MPRNTLGRHNAQATTAPTATTYSDNPPKAGRPTTLSDTVMLPFDWLVHLDRPVVNQLELLHVQAVKPFEVTQYFLQPPLQATDPVRKQVGQVPWFGVSPGPATAPQADGTPHTDTTSRSTHDYATGLTNNGLFRAFEQLRPRPWNKDAVGGRVRGRVNLNTVQDERVWTGLADPQTGSLFTATDVSNLWTTYIASKTQVGARTRDVATKKDATGKQSYTVPVPGQTVDDANPYDTANYTAANLAKLDRPFKSFGVAEIPQDPEVAKGKLVTTSPVIAPAGSGFQDTILRADPTSGATNEGLPMLWVQKQTHPYLEAELARKLMNNTTTTSNQFAVHITIVFHQVRLDPTTNSPLFETIPGGTPQRFLLGPEAYREVPGDMRAQYFAVVDRTGAVVQAADTSSPSTAIEPRPYFAALKAGVAKGDTTLTLENADTNGNVYSNGVATNIQKDDKLMVGSGSDAEYVKVASVSGGVITVTAAFSRAHPAGVVVSNAVVTRPTSPTGTAFQPFTAQFRTTSDYRTVVPYAERAR